MTTVFDGPMPTTQSTLRFEPVRDDLDSRLLAVGDLEDYFAGQANGLLGAAAAGCLAMVTGLQHGDVYVRIEVLPDAPALDDTWEEIVEVSFHQASAGLRVGNDDGVEITEFALPPGDYRVRYHAMDLDAASEAGIAYLSMGGHVIDSYLLQFWPAPRVEDGILRQTSETAAAWHEAWGPDDTANRARG